MSTQAAKLHGDVEKYIRLCKENKISQLKIEGICHIVMHDFAFYEQNLPNLPQQSEDFPTVSDDNSANIITDDILFHSSRS